MSTGGPSLSTQSADLHICISSRIAISQFSGVVNSKAVGIEAAPTAKGLVITTKNSKQPANAIKATKNTATIKKGGGRRASGLVSNVVAKRGYRSDLTQGTYLSFDIAGSRTSIGSKAKGSSGG